MKKKSLLLLFILLLAACGEKDEKTKSTFYKKEVIPSIYYTLAVHHVINGDFTNPPKPGLIEKGQTIRITATIENTGKTDYKFGGNPCSGDLTVSLSKGEKKVPGTGDITADFCIESYVEHVLKAGEKITASAKFNLKGVEPGVYKLSSSYANQQFVKELEIIDSP